MRKRETFRTMAVLLVLLFLVLMAASRSAQKVDQDYKVVYDEWHRQMDANPWLDGPQWFRTDVGPFGLRNATRNLLSIGPNLTPLIVEELRTETDRYRQFLLIYLLNKISGVNLYYGIGDVYVWDATPELIKNFIAKWDSGAYLRANELLATEWKDPDDGTISRKIDPNSIVPIRRYGIYALPFIIESLNQRNSSAVFAAYLIITGESDQYAKYIENPSTMFQAQGDKLSHIKAWARNNETKFDKLGALHTRIKAAAIQ
jgi:hypothetical protein